MEITHSKYFLTSLPFILASIAAPLIGAVDTAVVGRLGNYHYINAVALGAVIFSTIYWLFNFLGLTAAGFASQFLGEDNGKEELHAFLRGGILSLGIGAVIFSAKDFIFAFAVYYFAPPEETQLYIKQYFDIIILTVPLVLFYQTAQGWLAGVMQVKLSVAVGLSANIVNVVLDIVFVYYFNLGVAGVAAATAAANTAAFLFSLHCFWKHKPYPLRRTEFAKLFKGAAFHKLASCSFHLLIRTLCMLVMINTFMAQSSQFGGAVLAANSILMQIQYVMGDVFAGFSRAAAVYTGIAVGRNMKGSLIEILKISAVQCLSAGFLLAALYYIFRENILLLFTDLPEILAAARSFDIFIAFFPLVSAVGIVYYGVFNGALQTMPICASMVITLVCYLTAKYFFVPSLGNSGLWLAFLVFYVTRTAALLVFVPGFVRCFPYKGNKRTACGAEGA